MDGCGGPSLVVIQCKVIADTVCGLARLLRLADAFVRAFTQASGFDNDHTIEPGKHRIVGDATHQMPGEPARVRLPRKRRRSRRQPDRRIDQFIQSNGSARAIVAMFLRAAPQRGCDYFGLSTGAIYLAVKGPLVRDWAQKLATSTGLWGIALRGRATRRRGRTAERECYRS